MFGDRCEMCLLHVVCWLALLSAGPVTAGAETQAVFHPPRTWVFVVGLLKWQRADLWPPFPAAEVNRRDQQFVDYFRELGVPAEQVVYLKDEKATKAQIQRSFRKFLDQTDEGDLLVLYFAGHGTRDVRSDKTWFASYDAGDRYEDAWSVTSIFDTIENHFSGDRAWLLADCCHSGALYDEAIARRDSDIAYSALTSSYAHNSSTGRWTFSDAVLSGLRGRATVDTNHDGIVAWQELARYTELEMAFIEGQKSMFAAHPRFPGESRVAKAKGTVKPHVGERIEAWSQGKWYKARIIDSTDQQRKVHYLGYDTNTDEWVATNRVRAFNPPGFAEGAKVEVLWGHDQHWYPATVLKSWYGLHLIRYDGFKSTWNEWVKPAAIRARGKSN